MKKLLSLMLVVCQLWFPVGSFAAPKQKKNKSSQQQVAVDPKCEDLKQRAAKISATCEEYEYKMIYTGTDDRWLSPACINKLTEQMKMGYAQGYYDDADYDWDKTLVGSSVGSALWVCLNQEGNTDAANAWRNGWDNYIEVRTNEVGAFPITGKTKPSGEHYTQSEKEQDDDFDKWRNDQNARGRGVLEDAISITQAVSEAEQKRRKTERENETKKITLRNLIPGVQLPNGETPLNEQERSTLYLLERLVQTGNVANVVKAMEKLASLYVDYRSGDKNPIKPPHLKLAFLIFANMDELQINDILPFVEYKKEENSERIKIIRKVAAEALMSRQEFKDEILKNSKYWAVREKIKEIADPIYLAHSDIMVIDAAVRRIAKTKTKEELEDLALQAIEKFPDDEEGQLRAFATALIGTDVLAAELAKLVGPISQWAVVAVKALSQAEAFVTQIVQFARGAVVSEAAVVITLAVGTMALTIYALDDAFIYPTDQGTWGYTLRQLLTASTATTVAVETFPAAAEITEYSDAFIGGTNKIAYARLVKSFPIVRSRIASRDERRLTCAHKIKCPKAKTWTLRDLGRALKGADPETKEQIDKLLPMYCPGAENFKQCPNTPIDKVPGMNPQLIRMSEYQDCFNNSYYTPQQLPMRALYRKTRGGWIPTVEIIFDMRDVSVGGFFKVLGQNVCDALERRINNVLNGGEGGVIPISPDEWIRFGEDELQKFHIHYEEYKIMKGKKHAGQPYICNHSLYPFGDDPAEKGLRDEFSDWIRRLF